MEKTYSPHLALAKKYWKDLLQTERSIAIDATCGNGHDTLFLAGICSVIGLDIQSQAIQNTEILLQKHHKKATLYPLSHEFIDSLPLPYPPRLIVYNLGYLPHGDKSLTTQTETTLASVKKSLAMLCEGGALSITCYPGHEEGAKEEKALAEWIAQLPWAIVHHRWPERLRAPSLIWVLKSLKDSLSHP